MLGIRKSLIFVGPYDTGNILFLFFFRFGELHPLDGRAGHSHGILSSQEAELQFFLFMQGTAWMGWMRYFTVVLVVVGEYFVEHVFRISIASRKNHCFLNGWHFGRSLVRHVLTTKIQKTF